MEFNVPSNRVPKAIESLEIMYLVVKSKLEQAVSKKKSYQSVKIHKNRRFEPYIFLTPSIQTTT